MPLREGVEHLHPQVALGLGAHLEVEATLATHQREEPVLPVSQPRLAEEHRRGEPRHHEQLAYRLEAAHLARAILAVRPVDRGPVAVDKPLVRFVALGTVLQEPVALLEPPEQRVGALHYHPLSPGGPAYQACCYTSRHGL